MSSEARIKAQSSDIEVKAEVIEVYSQSSSIQLARISTQKAPRLGFFATIANGIGQVISDAASQAGKTVTETTTGMAEVINGMAYQAGKAALETAANVGEVLDSVTPPGLAYLSATANNMGEVIGSAAFVTGKMVAGTTAGFGEAIGNATSQSGKAVAQTLSEVVENIPSPASKAKIQEFGGSLIGATVGETVGGTLGAVVAGIAMGPAGAIVGTQVGSVVGFTIGAQLGEDAMRQVNQITQKNSETVSLDQVTEKLQKRGGEILGETIGGVAGGVAGRVVLGPIGIVVGSVAGQAIGGQLGEDTAHQLNPTNQPHRKDNVKPLSSEQAKRSWLSNTTCNFLGETGTAVIGGVIGVTVLGPKGKEVGRKIGLFVGRRTDWNPNTKIAANVEAGSEGEKQQYF
ncbi:hypothetical protein NIES4106_54320 (plasmid) [Fischerella sp. NIES-4106]|jgi:uncharacterized membrane protein|nr:hypothetical protein NIES4106_54320 [Fischerella sp. NIES-4106]